MRLPVWSLAKWWLFPPPPSAFDRALKVGKQAWSDARDAAHLANELLPATPTEKDDVP